MKAEQLTEVLRNHAMWLSGENGGERANLQYADLRYANLQSADLQSANLQSANLQYANLRSANLRSANLRSANLQYANLRSADLQSANLQYANLRSADLQSANLQSADLRSADLRSADLRSANLRSADLLDTNLQYVQSAIFAAASWSGHGVCGRQLLAVRIGKNDVYFCGCFRGSAKKLQKYITEGKEQYRASRQRVFDFVRGCMEATK